MRLLFEALRDGNGAVPQADGCQRQGSPSEASRTFCLETSRDKELGPAQSVLSCKCRLQSPTKDPGGLHIDFILRHVSVNLRTTQLR
jgi:hypothetical protein